MAAHQCPRCPLRFAFRTEVEAHLSTDHDDEKVAVRRGYESTTTADGPRGAHRPAGEPALSGQGSSP